MSDILKSLEEDENIRHITHRKRMRISGILHIGRGSKYQSYYTLEEDDNIRYINHWRRMRISEILHIGRGYQIYYT
jgi:predicted cupin superfamily sugar epimerase